MDSRDCMEMGGWKCMGAGSTRELRDAETRCTAVVRVHKNKSGMMRLI